MVQNATHWDWRRIALGVFAVLLFAAAAVLWWRPPAADTSGFIEMTRNSCLRGGLVVGALWLAYPQLVSLFARFAPSTILGTLGILAVVIIRPKAIIYVAPLIGIIVALKLVRWFFKG